tara:strand:+ start:192 stop:638 length:447 start_codon:yes stop_codon:yes gene_type:complete
MYSPILLRNLIATAKSLALAILFINLTPSLEAEENRGLDSKVIKCLHGQLPVTINYWAFDNEHVYRPVANQAQPLRIEKGEKFKYSSAAETIHWKTIGARPIHYTFDKQSLILKKSYRSRELSNAECEVMEVKELEAQYQKARDELKQ